MIKKYLLLKLYWNRSMSHLALPLAIFERLALVVILLKMFNVYNSLFVVIAGIFFTVGCLIVGWVDVHFHVYELENSVNNRYNRELQRLLRRGK